MSYIRFQTGLRCRQTGRWLGIFAAAGRLQDDLLVRPWFDEPMRETLSWFNKNLIVPKRDTIHWRCLFWFDRSSSEVIGNVWDLVSWLRQHDVYVQTWQSRDPGRIIYRDDHQVAAIPSQRLQRKLSN